MSETMTTPERASDGETDRGCPLDAARPPDALLDELTRWTADWPTFEARRIARLARQGGDGEMVLVGWRKIAKVARAGIGTVRAAARGDPGLPPLRVLAHRQRSGRRIAFAVVGDVLRWAAEYDGRRNPVTFYGPGSAGRAGARKEHQGSAGDSKASLREAAADADLDAARGRQDPSGS